MHAGDIEFALARHFNTRVNLIVPNVSWGLHLQHEVDLLVVTPSNWAYEVEIKISKSDLKRDILKSHGHKSNKIKRLYFAVPTELESVAMEFSPKTAGVITVDKWGFCKVVRVPKNSPDSRAISVAERLHLLELCAMRMWNAKESLRFYKSK